MPPVPDKPRKKTNARKQLVRDLWTAGTLQANGTTAVRQIIQTQRLTIPDAVVAIGKAASAMTLGALPKNRAQVPALVVTKYDHADRALALHPLVTVIEAAHPIPDEYSLIAGRKVLDFVTALPQGTHLMLLISGGASSLVDVLAEGVTLDDLKALNQTMISQDRTIEQINDARRKLSLIKSGGLLAQFNGAHVDVIYISDVQNDDPNVIGSGIGHLTAPACFSMNSFVAANNTQARAAVAKAAAARNLPVVENAETAYGDISDLAKTLAGRLRSGANGIYIWGGEPVVTLPPDPGNGGRNQALALLLARELRGRDDIAVAVGGTDGTDGPTTAAGGLIDGATYDPDQGHDAALATANSGAALAAADSLLVTGPTGTNVMDLIVAVKQP